MKHIVFYSSGIASYCAAKRVAEKYGTEDLILLFADTSIEDEDNYRFLHESAENVGGQLFTVRDGRTPWDVIEEQNFVNHRVAMCSMELKKEPCKKWLTKNNFTHENCTLYVGIDFNEYERMSAIEKGWSPYKVEAPLCWEPWADRPSMFELVAKEGIKPPRLYELGFAHANCGGFCFKSGKSQFKRLLETFPDRYAYHEKKEAQFIEVNGKPRIIREVIRKETTTISLQELRERFQSQLTLFDLEDWGGCGCFSRDD